MTQVQQKQLQHMGIKFLNMTTLQNIFKTMGRGIYTYTLFYTASHLIDRGWSFILNYAPKRKKKNILISKILAKSSNILQQSPEIGERYDTYIMFFNSFAFKRHSNNSKFISKFGECWLPKSCNIILKMI